MANHTLFAVFGGGCFWCTEAVFKEIKGVISVISGYAGGRKKNPTYAEVSAGETGHVEVVKVEYDPKIITYNDLLTVFFAVHDPTTPNQQGSDIGSQYRSVIFYEDPEDQQKANEFIAQLTGSGAFGRPVVTTVEPLGNFYPAEDYHREYYKNNSDAPYCRVIIAPKLKKLREKLRELTK